MDPRPTHTQGAGTSATPQYPPNIGHRQSHGEGSVSSRPPRHVDVRDYPSSGCGNIGHPAIPAEHRPPAELRENGRQAVTAALGNRACIAGFTQAQSAGTSATSQYSPNISHRQGSKGALPDRGGCISKPRVHCDSDQPGQSVGPSLLQGYWVAIASCATMVSRTTGASWLAAELPSPAGLPSRLRYYSQLGYQLKLVYYSRPGRHSRLGHHQSGHHCRGAT